MTLRIKGRVPLRLASRSRFAKKLDVEILAMPEEMDSLAFLEPVIDRLRSLLVTDSRCRDLSVLAQAEAIESIDVIQARPRFPVQLGALPALTSFAGQSRSEWSSVLGAPKLADLFIDHPTAECVEALPTRLKRLTLASAASVSSIPALPELQNLHVHGAKEFHVDSIRTPLLDSLTLESVSATGDFDDWVLGKELQKVVLENCGRVDGLRKLAHSSASVRIIGPAYPAPREVLRALASESRGRWFLPPAITE